MNWEPCSDLFVFKHKIQFQGPSSVMAISLGGVGDLKSFSVGEYGNLTPLSTLVSNR